MGLGSQDRKRPFTNSRLQVSLWCVLGSKAAEVRVCSGLMLLLRHTLFFLDCLWWSVLVIAVFLESGVGSHTCLLSYMHAY